MAEFGDYTGISAKASADLREARYTIQRFTAAGECNIASNAAATAVLGAAGVLQNKPNSGQAMELAITGESKVVAGEAVTANTLITTNGSGRAAEAGSGDIVVGRALVAAVQDGDVIRAWLMDPMRMIGT